MSLFTQAEKVELLKRNEGKTFGVEFIKKDGSLRKMNARLGVVKHLTTGDVSTTAHLPQYLTVFDMQKKGYRNINVDTLVRLNAKGSTINF